MKKIGNELVLTLPAARCEELSLSVSDRRDALLEFIFGSKLDRILGEEQRLGSDPMLVLASGFLDRGKLVNGEQTWVFGWYGLWMTTGDYSGFYTKSLVGAPMYRGHIGHEEWHEPPCSIVWAGMRSELSGLGGGFGGVDEPAVIFYPKADETKLRSSLRHAMIMGTMERDFPMSLRHPTGLEFDEQTQRILKVRHPKRTSLDFVRNQGTEEAAAEKMMALSAGQNIETGEQAMRYQFETIEAMLADKDVQRVIAEETTKGVSAALSKPEKVEEIVLSAPAEVVLKHRGLIGYVKVDEIVEKISPEQVEQLLSSRPEVMEQALSAQKHLEDRKAEVLSAMRAHGVQHKLPEMALNAAIATADLSSLTKEQGIAKIDAALSACGLKCSGGSQGESERPEHQDGESVRRSVVSRAASAVLGR
ncbi:hypothetical protein KJZ99_00065 [bacterium]|nr:hypothetical protein [bacterium]